MWKRIDKTRVHRKMKKKDDWFKLLRDLADFTCSPTFDDLSVG